MKTKRSIIYGIFSLMLLLSVGMALGATVTSITPTSGAYITGTYVFNASVNVTELMTPLYCNWSTTANGVFAKTTNSSANQTIFTNSSNTASLTETASTTLTITCFNGSTASSTTATIGIDNTNPTCSFRLDIGEKTLDYMDPIGVTPTDESSDTTTLTYLWTLWDPAKNSQDTSTSSAPTFQAGDFDEVGEFTLGLTITDQAGLSTACTNQTIYIRGTNGDESVITATQQQGQQIVTLIKQNKTPIIVLGGLVLVAILAVLSFFIINKSKK